MEGLSGFYSTMNSLEYIHWKKWSGESFGAITPGSQFHFHQIFGSSIRSNSNILEIGFGNGELLAYFRKNGHNVIGIETNHLLVERACGHSYTAYLGQVWEIADVQSARFDVIVLFAVAEHMSAEQLTNLFNWAQGHLNYRGKMYLKFPEGASPLGLGYQHGDFTHMSCLTKTKIEELCTGSTLKLTHYYDEPLISNALCSRGVVGIFALMLLQFYGCVLKALIKVVMFPLSPSLRLSTNSIAVISNVG